MVSAGFSIPSTYGMLHTVCTTERHLGSEKDIAYSLSNESESCK